MQWISLILFRGDSFGLKHERGLFWRLLFMLFLLQVNTRFNGKEKRCNQRTPTDCFAGQNGRGAEQADIRSKNLFDKQTAT